MHTHKLDVLGSGASLPSQFGLNMIIFVSFGDLNVQDWRLAGLVTDRSFLHLKYNQKDQSLSQSNPSTHYTQTTNKKKKQKYSIRKDSE